MSKSRRGNKHTCHLKKLVRARGRAGKAYFDWYEKGYSVIRRYFKNLIYVTILKLGFFPPKMRRFPRSWLDVGCAYGFLVETVSDLGIDVYGIDVSSFALSQARKNNLGDKVILASAEYIPFKNDVLDVVSAYGVIEHLERPERALKEFNRILKDQGSLLFSTAIPNPENQGSEIRVSIKGPGAWKSDLEKAGFRVTLFYYVGGISRVNTKRWLKVLYMVFPAKLANFIMDVTLKLLGRTTARKHHLYLIAENVANRGDNS